MISDRPPTPNRGGYFERRAGLRAEGSFVIMQEARRRVDAMGKKWPAAG